MFAVVVTLKIKPGRMNEFLPAITRNARQSLWEEAGCHRFDECTDHDRPEEVLLYELYTDRGAFEMHLQSAHFAAFDRETAHLIEDKTLRFFAQVQS